jgi:hypothetical protein
MPALEPLSWMQQVVSAGQFWDTKGNFGGGLKWWKAPDACP